MATHPSALRRHRQSVKKNKRNRYVRSTIRTSAKKVLETVAEKKTDEASAVLKQAIVQIDKAASKNVLKKKTASRKISRLSKRVHALKTL